MNNLSDEEDEELCNTIINAMQNYLDDKDYFGQLHENSYQSDFADKFFIAYVSCRYLADRHRYKN